MGKLHRFYITPEVELKHDFWLHDQRLVNQWRKVLRFRPSQEIILFDGVEHEKLYKILEINDREAHLNMVTEMSRKLPARHIYLLWSLLKKDKNDWVLQKCTELGVRNFVPLVADRSEKTGFNLDRARKIIIEAAEQCGRSDIPTVRNPIHISTAIDELNATVKLLACEQSEEGEASNPQEIAPVNLPIGLLIGPEGGWSDSEIKLFKKYGLNHLSLHDFTLRAETACVAAISTLS